MIISKMTQMRLSLQCPLTQCRVGLLYVTCYKQQIFKKDGRVTALLNLIVRMEMGNVVGLYWENQCYGVECAFIDCKDTTLYFNQTNFTEQVITSTNIQNCFIPDCNSDSSVCDTKVYITWEGTDATGRECTSDNYRITKFTEYSINSLLQSAKEIGETTYNKLVNQN